MATPEPTKTVGQALDDIVAPGTIGGAIKDLGTRVFGSGTAEAAPPATPVVQNEPPLVPVAAPVATPAPVVEPAFVPPPPQTVKQSETRTQIQGGVKLDPKIEAEKVQARAAQATAIANATEAEADALKRIAAAEKEHADRVATEHRRQEADALEQRKFTDEQLARVKAARDAVPEKPPEDSVGTKVARGIAYALNVFGRALGGSVDVHQVIEQDKANKLNAWKAQYERSKGRIVDEQNIYALLRQQKLDDTQAGLVTIQRLNDDYGSLIRAEMAASKAPLVIEQGKAKLEALRQENLAIDQKLYGDAQARWTQVRDERSKTGGVDVENKSKLIKLANDDDYIKRYRAASAALARFRDLVTAGADGAALANFIAGKGGLEQGSFGPNFVELLKKRSVFSSAAEKVRSGIVGGVDPGLLKDLENGLAAELATATQEAKPSIQQFRRDFASAGIDPALVTGGETSATAAAEAGAAPSSYQGKK